jgi:hypothetical protein
MITKKGYESPITEVMEVQFTERLMQASIYGDGGYPGQIITDDPDYNYEI